MSTSPPFLFWMRISFRVKTKRQLLFVLLAFSFHPVLILSHTDKGAGNAQTMIMPVASTLVAVAAALTAAVNNAMGH